LKINLQRNDKRGGERKREREREMAAAVDQFFYTTAVSGIIIY
jgi:hypothetical protein